MGLERPQAHPCEFCVKHLGTIAVTVVSYFDDLLAPNVAKQYEHQAQEDLPSSFPIKVVVVVSWDREVTMVLLVNNATHRRRPSSSKFRQSLPCLFIREYPFPRADRVQTDADIEKMRGIPNHDVVLPT